MPADKRPVSMRFFFTHINAHKIYTIFCLFKPLESVYVCGFRVAFVSWNKPRAYRNMLHPISECFIVLELQRVPLKRLNYFSRETKATHDIILKWRIFFWIPFGYGRRFFLHMYSKQYSWNAHLLEKRKSTAQKGKKNFRGIECRLKTHFSSVLMCLEPFFQIHKKMHITPLSHKHKIVCTFLTPCITDSNRKMLSPQQKNNSNSCWFRTI